VGWTSVVSGISPAALVWLFLVVGYSHVFSFPLVRTYHVSYSFGTCPSIPLDLIILCSSMIPYLLRLVCIGGSKIPNGILLECCMAVWAWPSHLKSSNRFEGNLNLILRQAFHCRPQSVTKKRMI